MNDPERKTRGVDVRREARRPGFTMVEILVVIAVIAILAAFLFPLIVSVREGGKKKGCMENMRQVVQALKLYKEDYGVYPEALYGYYEVVGNNPPTARHFLYPQYIKAKYEFRCPASEFKVADPPPDAETNPNSSPDLNERCLSPGLMMHQGGAPTTGRYYFPWDTYDAGLFPNLRPQGLNCGNAAAPFANPPLALQLRYQVGWFRPIATVTMNSATGPKIDRRQMAWRSPSDETVVTWCTNHFNMSSVNAPLPNGSEAIVAFLDGRVQIQPAAPMLVWDNADGHTWRTHANP